MLHIVAAVDIGNAGRYEQFLELFLGLWRCAAPTSLIHVAMVDYNRAETEGIGTLATPTFPKIGSRHIPVPKTSPEPLFHVFVAKKGNTYPVAAVTKTYRLLCATLVPDDDVVMLTDIDMLPIAFEPEAEKIQTAMECSRLVSVGGDAYEARYHLPICYLFARAKDWWHLTAPLTAGVLGSGLSLHGFSDESALRFHIEEFVDEGIWSTSEIAFFPRLFGGRTTTSDRINRNEKFDQEKLDKGGYLDAHLSTIEDNCIPAIVDYHCRKQQKERGLDSCQG